MARVTASVRLWALSLPMLEFTWNLTVCSLTSKREATPLLGNPSALQQHPREAAPRLSSYPRQAFALR